MQRLNSMYSSRIHAARRNGKQVPTLTYIIIKKKIIEGCSSQDNF